LVLVRTLGRQLVAEYYACDPVLLDDAEHLRGILLAAAERIGARIIGETFHRFPTGGVSGTLVIAESHLSIHTWPEGGYAAVDLFTCGGLDPRPGFELIGHELAAASGRMQEIVRGLPEEIERDGTILPEDVMILSRATEAVCFGTAGSASRRRN